MPSNIRVIRASTASVTESAMSVAVVVAVAAAADSESWGDREEWKRME